MQLRVLIYSALCVLMISCGRTDKASSFISDSLLVRKYIRTGDSIYSTKSSYTSFLKSMECYDSALQVAESSHDTALIAFSVFAKGRAYDAINSNPQKTIDYYKEAARLYATLPNKYIVALYIKHLVAHSYDKVNDSVHCVAVLQELYNEIGQKPDSIKQQMKFTAEMALISTEVKNYLLADDILLNLTKRSWIKNDTNEYDYLDHYYLTQSRIDVFQNRLHNTPYMDSLELVLVNCDNISDSIYYSHELWSLYNSIGNKNKENFYLDLYNTTFERFHTKESVREATDRLARIEVAAIESQRKAEAEKAETRKWSIYMLVLLLSAISLLALFLIKRNREVRRKKMEMININKQLNQKNLQNDLLNKEIHHRVKNNLQMILSLVYMQEKNTVAEEAKTNLLDIRLRIENIAAMHQQLLEQNSNVVDLKQYVMKLVNTVASLVGNGYHVFTHLDIDDISISAKQSFPLGLLLNEMVTNTVKYASPTDNILVVYVTIKLTGNTVTLHYHDSGKPVKKEQVTAGLGMNIINLLANQLNGELIRNEHNYFDCEIKFPLDGE